MKQPVSGTDLVLQPDGRVYHLGLRPENISEDIITVGDPGRVPEVSKYFDKVDWKSSHREFVTHTGELRGRRITVVSTGMGTDNVEIFLTEMDALVNVDLSRREPKRHHTTLRIVRVGTSGSFQSELSTGSQLISESAVGLDNLMSFYRMEQSDRESLLTKAISQATGVPQPYLASGSDPLLEKFGTAMIKGNTVTCPGFYAPQGRKIRMSIRYPRLLDDLQGFSYDGFRLTNFEMETSGYYALGKLLGHEVVSASVILANRSNGEFSKHPEQDIDSLIRNVLDRF